MRRQASADAGGLAALAEPVVEATRGERLPVAGPQEGKKVAHRPTAEADGNQFGRDVGSEVAFRHVEILCRRGGAHRGGPAEGGGCGQAAPTSITSTPALRAMATISAVPRPPGKAMTTVGLLSASIFRLRMGPADRPCWRQSA